ncbi:hypothetical protein COO91_05989 [Nostoc flagelliforme CCNUN1]|uniref:Uncharacterized protein n=1 Tax=Nostoc flagelliforme CCNUN1 TaxID=2038116 RepID=A0A2K8SXC3_9NOSO|nr:hypothetical protein COO91_05989 [Nostoc flagelliforme CCNUN1]
MGIGEWGVMKFSNSYSLLPTPYSLLPTPHLKKWQLLPSN